MPDHLDRTITGRTLRSAEFTTQGDITLFEAMSAIWSRKWNILAIIAVASLIGLAIAFILTPMYASEAVVAIRGSNSSGLEGVAQRFSGLASLTGISVPSGSPDKSIAVATLSSRQLLMRFVSQPDVHPVIVARMTNGKADSEEPSVVKITAFFRRHYLVTEQKTSGLILVKVTWINPETARNWTNQLVQMADDTLRSRAIERSSKRLKELRTEYASQTIVTIRDAISEVLEEEFRTMTIAKADEEFAFQVVDPAIASERPIRPQRLLIVAAFLVVGVLAGCLWAIGAAVKRSQLGGRQAVHA